jgi:hypothetical protein
MGTATEQNLINKLAGHFESLSDIKTAYGFANNPDSLASGTLPVAIFRPIRSSLDLAAHHNIWRNDMTIDGIVCVIERQAAGGKLRNIENRAISLMQALRVKMTTESVVKDLLAVGLSRHYTFTLEYREQINYMGIEYVGLTCQFNFSETG